MYLPASTVFVWLTQNTETFEQFEEGTLINLMYLLGGLSHRRSIDTKKKHKVVELIDSDFPAFNDVLRIPESKQHIVPFIDFQLDDWEYDHKQGIAVQK